MERSLRSPYVLSFGVGNTRLLDRPQFVLDCNATGALACNRVGNYTFPVNAYDKASVLST
jgi:hypothetical protein